MEAEISVMDLQEKQQQESWVFPSSWKRGMEQMVRALRTSEPSEVTTLPTPWFHITSLLKGEKKKICFSILSLNTSDIDMWGFPYQGNLQFLADTTWVSYNSVTTLSTVVSAGHTL